MRCGHERGCRVRYMFDGFLEMLLVSRKLGNYGVAVPRKSAGVSVARVSQSFQWAEPSDPLHLLRTVPVALVLNLRTVRYLS